MRYQLQSFAEGTQHEVLVDLGGGEVDKGLNAVVLHTGNHLGIAEGFKTMEHFAELLVIAQVEMGIQQVVQTFDIMCGFHVDHMGLVMKKVHPFLCMPVIHDKILADKSIPAIALVQVEPFIKSIQEKCIGWQLLLEKFFNPIHRELI